VKDFKYQVGMKNKVRTVQRAKIILDNLIRLHPKGKKLLDIGSGFGFFIKEASKVGLKPAGIEPSKLINQIPMNRFIEKYNATFDQFYMLNNKRRFDFITLIHSIEHVANPKEFLDKACLLLNPGGILYLETPNLNSHLFWAEKENYTFLTPPEHLYLFSKKSMRTILKDHPSLKIIKSSTYSYPEHLMGTIKAISKIKKQRSKIGTESNLSNKIKSSKIRNINLKFVFFDKILAPLFTPLLNVNGYGSVLELYMKKK